MTPPTGFQIAFLLLAAHFFPAVGTIPIARMLGWTESTQQIVSQSVAFAVIAAAILGIGALRGQCVSALRRPVPAGMRAEIIGVAIAKCATVMAVSGAVVLWHFAMATPDELMHYAKPEDAEATWDSVFSPQGLVRMVLLSWIIGPVIEELVFRGFLYHAWERQWGWFPSLLLTSACFGIAHPSHMASAFMGSVIYICIMRRTGTIVAPILLHVLFNVLVSWPVLGEVSSRIPHGTTTDLWSWWPWLASVAFVSIALPAYVWMARDGSRAASAFAASSHS